MIESPDRRGGPGSPPPGSLGRTRPAARAALVLAAVAALTIGLVVAVQTSATAATRRAAACSAGYVALTFDDGPTQGYTSTLLSTLRASGARATMFNTGQNAQNHPSLVTAQRDAGMWIGNHSWSHPHLTRMSRSQMLAELSRTQDAIRRVTGTAPRLFRPPYGETDATLRSVERELGLTEVLWDVDSRDWAGASTAQIVQAARGLRDGQVILMHDGYASTIAAIPQIVADLESRGLCPGMISPETGRAVAPSGTGGGDGDGGETCDAWISPGRQWDDRFNLSVTVSGTSDWVATVTVHRPQRIIATWNGSPTWDPTGTVMTMVPDGSGNVFGFTVQHNGDRTWPSVSCRAG